MDGTRKGVDDGRVKSPLEVLLGRTAARLLLHLVHYGEAYARGASQDLGIALGPVQRQFEKLEAAGFLVSKRLGTARVYRVNPKSPAARKLLELGEVFYEGIPLEERQRLFATRRRPRRAGKP